MKGDWISRVRFGFVLGLALLLPAPGGLLAHCDGMDGPVVKAAQRALEAGNVNLVLIWVQKNDEAEIRTAFEKTLAVRKLNAGAKELADLYFFETLVRVHRAGEGAPYTGLKPAGRDLGPAIPAADRAIETGSAEPLIKLLTNSVQDGMAKLFRELKVRQNFRPDNVEAGREYVKAYVQFIHYVEGIHQSVERPASGHFPEPAEGGALRLDH